MYMAVVILAMAIPAWVPIMRNHQLWPTLRGSVVLFAALILFTTSEILQLVFLGCVSAGLLTLDYSLTFAQFGIPCCVLALVLPCVTRMKNAVGVGFSSLLSLAAWLFFISLH